MGLFDETIGRVNRPEFTFVQIGANDGIRDDPIHKYVVEHGWRGILVEPLPGVFQKLQDNYRQALPPEKFEKLTFINAAVVNRAGPTPFYRHPKHSVCSGLAVCTRMQQKSRDKMQRITVNGVRADNIALRAPISLDLLQIDTEGFDGEIIRLWPFALRLPRVVHYEHKHLGPIEQAEVRGSLRGHGYEVAEDGDNTVAELIDWRI